MRVLLVSRIDNRDALAFTEEIRAMLTKGGCDVFLDSDTASALGTGGIPVADAKADVVMIANVPKEAKLQVMKHFPKVALMQPATMQLLPKAVM